VRRYHGDEAARAAEQEFLGVFSRRDQLPDDVPDISVPPWPVRILDVILSAKLAPSNSEARRLMQQGGVTLDGERVSDPNAQVLAKDGAILKVGKRRFARLRVGACS
jgi:tyrosyl-tRNA synthetase